jgi:[glutamine synthetase] adenylyltransferase / [glutamine synthetase]-adenylyl-L-tyrosine phosphorylase
MPKPLLSPELQTEAQERRRALAAALGHIAPAAGQAFAERPELDCALVLSDFIMREALVSPQIPADLLQSGDLDHAYPSDGFQKRLRSAWLRDFTTPPGQAAYEAITTGDFEGFVRLFRRREMLRIAVRDLCGWAELAETMADLSRLADTCLQLALDYHYGQQALAWGRPADRQGTELFAVVLGLGKLGAHELNFSSDVDLMFAYAAEGTTRGGTRGTTSNEDFFIRVVRGLIRAIGAHTPEGFVFRVDARLRPFGESGPLVMSFDRLEDYYQEQGREWERYALIKARVVAGDQEAGHKLLERLRPFIYRRYLDYGVFEGLREMKARIAGEMSNRDLADDIKLGPGGIREIEFFGQMFQLIRGGVEPTLQIRPIQRVLEVLVQKGYIPQGVAATLEAAYIFLRLVENRLQVFADQQIHRLPADPGSRVRLAAAMGFTDWPTFEEVLSHHRQNVHHHFNALLTPTQADDPLPNGEAAGRWLENLAAEAPETDLARDALTDLGYRDPVKVLQLIRSLHDDRRLQSISSTGRQRLQRLLPLLVRAAGRAEAPEAVLDRIFDLIKSISQRTAYLALLLENPATLEHLVHLTGASPWISAFLTQHPVVLDELLDPRTLYRPPKRNALVSELAQRLIEIDADDLEYQMEALRVFKQINVLRVAASDITHVLPLMKVSDHLSDIAETVIAAAVTLCWQNLTRKYGLPARNSAPGDNERGFAVIAYGKLGGLELGYGSDLDLVFLHAAEPGDTTGTARSIDSGLFFSRLGQRVLHILTTHTPAGKLYEADMRLRPSGDSGILVCHIDAFRNYQQDNAWNWEHQALIRARAVSGDQVLRRRFEDIRREILTQRRDAEPLRRTVADMRARLRKEHTPPDAAVFDIKHGLGGIIDIEFLVQFLVLRHAHSHPEIVHWTDNVRLLQSLNESGILDETTAFGLRRAYLIYRAMVHRLDLRQQPAQVADHRFGKARRFVIQVWNRFLSPPILTL